MPWPHIRRYVISCIVLWALLRGTDAGAQGVHRHYTQADGLPSSMVYMAMRDRDGFMWFATESGASRFDGHTFTNYGLAEGLMDREVLWCTQDSHGRIWFLHVNGKLCYYLDGRIHNERTDPQLRLPFVVSGWARFAEAPDGGLWFGSPVRKLMRLNADASFDTLITFDTGTLCPTYDRHGDLIILRSGKVYTWWERALHLRYTLPDAVIGGFTYDLVPAGMDPLVVTLRGVVAMDTSGTSLVLPASDGVDIAVHRRAWRDARGDLWMHRLDDGIDRYRWNGASFGKQERLLPSERVNHVFVDPDGDYWACTRRGVSVITKQQQMVRTFKGVLAEKDESMSELYLDGSGQMWVGSDLGMLYRFGANGLVRVGIKGDLGRVNHIDEADDGRLFVATDRDMIVLSPAPARVPYKVPYRLFSKAPLGPQMAARCVESGASGRVYGSYTGIDHVFEEEGVLLSQPLLPDVVPQIRIYALHEDRKGRLWFETNEHLHVLDGDSCRTFPEVASRTGLRITDITGYRGDTLVLGTAGKGILLVHEGRPLISSSDRPIQALTDVRRVRVRNDTIWTAGSGGVQGLVLEEGTLRLVAQVGRREGLPTDDAHDVLAHDGQLFVATDAGLCVMPIPVPEPAKEAPRPFLASVVLDDSVIAPGPSISLRAGVDRLKLVLRALEFIDQDALLYQYRLRPDQPWSAMSDGRVDLASLAAGDYHFEARVRMGQGPWSDPLSMDIAVLPPWYARPWVILAMWVLAALLLLQIGAWAVRRQHRRDMQRLAELNMLNEERRRIAADVHDDLGADLSQLLVRAHTALERRDLEAGHTAIEALSVGLKGTMEKIDEIIWSLDPGRDNARSTADFIENWVRTYAHACGLQFRSSIEAASAEEHVVQASHRREMALVVKEAMRNVVRHAGATRVHLAIEVKGRTLRVALEDDGMHSPIGVRPSGRSGLANMQRRVGRMNGRMGFAEVRPQGTRFSAEFPLDTPSPEMMM